MKIKTTILIFMLGMGLLSATAQTKPRKVTIKKSVTINKDSTYYLPDTIACVFKELIITKDSIFEKWQHGYVVWQQYSDRAYNTNNWSYGSGDISIYNSEPLFLPYEFNKTHKGKFLYSNYQPVNNIVTQAYK